jgi:hypothetical protein
VGGHRQGVRDKVRVMPSKRGFQDYDEFGGGLGDLSYGHDINGNTWVIDTGVKPLTWKLTMKDGRTASGTAVNMFGAWQAVSDAIAKGTPVAPITTYTVTQSLPYVAPPTPTTLPLVAAAPPTSPLATQTRPLAVFPWWDQMWADFLKFFGVK